MVRNPASGRVLEKLGMKPEGVLRQRVRKWGVFEDVVLMAILHARRTGAVAVTTRWDFHRRFGELAGCAAKRTLHEISPFKYPALMGTPVRQVVAPGLGGGEARSRTAAYPLACRSTGGLSQIKRLRKMIEKAAAVKADP